MTKPFDFTTPAKISAGITSLAKTGKTLQAKAHALAVATLNHADQHNDCTLFQRLHDSLPSMSRTNALKAWGLHYGPIRWDNKANDGKGAFRISRPANYAFDVEAAASKPFYEFEKEAKFKAFDLEKSFNALLKRAADFKSGDDADKHKIDPALFSKLQALSTATEIADAA